MANFPSELAAELIRKSKEIKKPIYASYCSCGNVAIKSAKFTEEEEQYCVKCNPKPMSIPEILLFFVYALPTLALIIWLFTV